MDGRGIKGPRLQGRRGLNNSRRRRRRSSSSSRSSSSRRSSNNNRSRRRSNIKNHNFIMKYCDFYK